MTHVDVGTFRIDSFTHVCDVDWDIPGYMSRAIERDLSARGTPFFIPLALNQSGDWRRSMAENILSAMNVWVPGELKAFLEKTTQENRLEAIVTVSSYSSGRWQKNACFKIGQGVVDLFTLKGRL